MCIKQTLLQYVIHKQLLSKINSCFLCDLKWVWIIMMYMYLYLETLAFMWFFFFVVNIQLDSVCSDLEISVPFSVYSIYAYVPYYSIHFIASHIYMLKACHWCCFVNRFYWGTGIYFVSTIGTFVLLFDTLIQVHLNCWWSNYCLSY